MDGGSTTADDTQYVTLGLDREIFAVPVDGVREILDMLPVSRVPNAPAFMLGMIDVRGQSVPVIDLRTKLGLSPTEATVQTRIIVLDVVAGGKPNLMGLVADRVLEVTPLAEAALTAPPEVGVRWRSDYIRAIGRRNGNFVIIFDLSRLFSSEEVALVNAGTVPPGEEPELAPASPEPAVVAET
jgi:purine-binding chemotaxis protein CheW